ncbi:MAG: cation diffusion facilitator family transporter [Actinomycetes bacterium]
MADAPVADDRFAAPVSGGAESRLTVIVAFGANLLIAVAKTGAAVITGSASLVAEAAHSWADTGNEVFLLIAQRRSVRPADTQHPAGHGREAYVWSLFAAVGLFAVGAAVSVTHGISELVSPEPAQNFVVAYVVLGIAFVLEGISFARSTRQARTEAARVDRDLFEHVLVTSDPTLRAVFAEDAAALVGLVIAFAGVALHELTGSPVPDAIGSILVGVLLGVVSVLLIDRNRRFIVGEAVDPRLRAAALARLLAEEQVAAVTYLQMEFTGPRQVSVLARVDLLADHPESQVAATLAELERRIEALPVVSRAILAPAHPGSAPLAP